MDERKAAILEAVVEQYVRTGAPVGSQTIARASALGVSSATVRNELIVLEREGYVTHPHTSAGRVPTDLGYRFFVDHRTQPPELNPGSRQAVAEFFAGAHRELEELLQETSRLLSRVTSCAALVVGPQPDMVELLAVQVVRLYASHALIVVVLSGGVVEKRPIELDEVIDEATLTRVSNMVAAQLTGHRVSELPALVPTGDPAVDQLAGEVREALVAWRGAPPGEAVYVGGASRIAAEPRAFSAVETVARLLDLLEQQYLVVTLVRGLLDEGVTVRIGAENSMGELRECSMVLARYTVDDRVAGAVGVLGPTRMDYPGVMASVAAISRRLGEHLSRLA